MNNSVKTITLFGVLTVIIVTLGGFIGGRSGIFSAFIFSLISNAFMYLYSDKIVLSASGAKPMSRSDYPKIYKYLEELCLNMKIPEPKLFITPDKQANAFATGRGPGDSSVAFTSGILKLLPDKQIKGVLAHELAHIKNRDVLTATIAAVMASTISFISNMFYWGGHDEDGENNQSGIFGIVLALITPIAASIVQMAISREREYQADYKAAKTLGGGEGLADALESIHTSTKQYPTQLNPAFSSLYIDDPMGSKGSNILHLFSTHPPVKERVKRLRQI